MGSEIEFNTTHSAIKPLVTHNLTLTCRLPDTTPVGPAVGRRRRSLTSLTTVHLDNADLSIDDFVTQNNIEDLERSDDLGDSDDLEERSVSVTQTDDNMDFVTSIIISKDGKDLATITEHVPATSLDGASGFQVYGQLSGLTGGKGYLQLVWTHPGPAEAGNYRCDIDALTNRGRSFDFTKTLSVSEEEVTMQDLVTHLQKAELDKLNLHKTIDNQNKEIATLLQSDVKMQTTIDNQTKTIDNQTQNIQQMRSTIENQAKVITDQGNQITSLQQFDVKLNQSLSDLSSKARLEPDVFFTAVVDASHTGWVVQNKSPLFFPPISNQGSSFDKNTGIFTAPISGFYHFELYVYSDADDAWFNIEKNGVKVVSVRCHGDDGYRASSNSVYLRLDQGDKVSAVARQRSYIYGRSGDWQLSTFSGRLVGLP